MKSSSGCNKLISLTGSQGILQLKLKYESILKGAWRICVICPLWIHNTSGLPLQFIDYVVHPTEGKPLLYSPKKGEPTHIKIGGSQWSKAVPLVSGTSGVLEVPGHNDFETYDLALSVQEAPEPFSRVNIAYFSARFALSNSVATPLKFKLPGFMTGVVPPDKNVPIYCGNNKRLQARYFS